MGSSAAAHISLSKQALFDAAGPGLISQTGGEVIDTSFDLPNLSAYATALPSIETFVVSASGDISALGDHEDLNAAWLPTIEKLTQLIGEWADSAGIEIIGDSYITASVTSASEVNGEAHFDDDQFDPHAGAGLVAIVGDLGGPRVASQPIPHHEISAPRPVTASEDLIAAFADGAVHSNAYGGNELVVLPQFAQLHAGPGPCGTAEEVRHLLVYRANTATTG